MKESSTSEEYKEGEYKEFKEGEFNIRRVQRGIVMYEEYNERELNI